MYKISLQETAVGKQHKHTHTHTHTHTHRENDIKRKTQDETLLKIAKHGDNKLR